MFELFTIIDEVILEPDQIGPNMNDQEYHIKDKIIHRYHNKLIPKAGLCIKI